MRILHISESDGNGGAARAAFRTHRALVSVESSTGFKSHMLVRKSVEHDSRIAAIRPSRSFAAVNRLRHPIENVERSLLHTENRIIHSTARLPTPALRQILSFEPDAVLLHWLGNRVLSIKQVGELSRLGVPVFWFLHDTWAFCGAEHYPHGDMDRRFAEGYQRTNRPGWESGLDVNRHTWNRKRRYWTQPMRIIALSEWIGHLASSSVLMGGWPIDVVPYPVDVEWWSALPREEARRELGIAQRRRVVLFGAAGGENDPRKGADLFRAALLRLSESVSAEVRQSLDVLTFGGNEGVDRIADFTVRSVGQLNDEGLRRFYSAADVMVVPSRVDNLPQTAVEPTVCGTPVVGFRIGGMADIVTDGITGRLVEPFSTEALSDAICWVVEDDERRSQLSSRARQSAEKWSPEIIGMRLAALISGARSQTGVFGS